MDIVGCRNALEPGSSIMMIEEEHTYSASTYTGTDHPKRCSRLGTAPVTESHTHVTCLAAPGMAAAGKHYETGGRRALISTEASVVAITTVRVLHPVWADLQHRRGPAVQPGAAWHCLVEQPSSKNGPSVNS